MNRIEAIARGLALARYGDDAPPGAWRAFINHAADIVMHECASRYADDLMAVKETAEQQEAFEIEDEEVILQYIETKEKGVRQK